MSNKVKTSKYVIGIDPGNSGAYALLPVTYKRGDKTLIEGRLPVEHQWGKPKTHKVVDANKLVIELDYYTNILGGIIEEITTNNKKLVMNYGICYGSCRTNEIDLLCLQPLDWMKQVSRISGFKYEGNKDKCFTFGAYEEIFGECKHNDDNKCDAALIAYLALDYHKKGILLP